MEIVNKYTVGLLVALITFGAGYYSGKGDREVQIQEKVVYEKGEKEIVIRDKIVTVTKIVKPDGTVEEVTKTEDKQVAEKSTSTSTEKDKVVVSTPKLSKYSLGLKYWIPLSDKSSIEGNTVPMNAYAHRNIENWEAVLGYRVAGEVWVIGGYRFSNEVSLGVQFQF